MQHQAISCSTRPSPAAPGHSCSTRPSRSARAYGFGGALQAVLACTKTCCNGLLVLLESLASVCDMVGFCSSPVLSDTVDLAGLSLLAPTVPPSGSPEHVEGRRMPCSNTGQAPLILRVITELSLSAKSYLDRRASISFSISLLMPDALHLVSAF